MKLVRRDYTSVRSRKLNTFSVRHVRVEIEFVTNMRYKSVLLFQRSER